MFAGAAFLLLLAMIMLSVAFAYFINLIFGLDLAWCFLIVFGVYVLIAGAAGLPRHPQRSRRCGRPSERSHRPQEIQERPLAGQASASGAVAGPDRGAVRQARRSGRATWPAVSA